MTVTFRLDGPIRELAKHSSMYGLGQILSRLASILLLPVYTRYLSPSDYGIIAILDLTVGVLSIVTGTGMGAALSRYHFNANDKAERDRVWWTGFTFVVLVSTVAIVPIWLSSGALARLTLGQSVASGEFFYKLILPTLWFAVIGGLPDAYLKTRKWSGISVGLNLVRLLLNIGLNLYFLVVLGLGVTGLLLGNLITGGVMTVMLLGVMSNNLGPYAFHRPLIPILWGFGSPLIVTGLLSIILHQADRYFIRVYLSLDQVGLYSFAYTIGQAVNTLILLPFSTIWNIVIYEIAAQPDAKSIYVKVFEYFVYGLLLVILGVALFARQIVGMIVPPSYSAAADLIPLLCLAYFFFSLHEHFKVPVMLAKKTTLFLPVFGIAVAINALMNLVLIPVYGIAGAASASVVSFATFSIVGLWRYRRIDKYPYPLTRCGGLLIGMAGSYIAYQRFVDSQYGFANLAVAILIWLLWGVFLFRILLRRVAVEYPNVVHDHATLKIEQP